MHHSDHFELQGVAFTASTWLNALSRCHVIGISVYLNTIFSHLAYCYCDGLSGTPSSTANDKSPPETRMVRGRQMSRMLSVRAKRKKKHKTHKFKLKMSFGHQHGMAFSGNTELEKNVLWLVGLNGAAWMDAADKATVFIFFITVKPANPMANAQDTILTSQ